MDDLDWFGSIHILGNPHIPISSHFQVLKTFIPGADRWSKEHAAMVSVRITLDSLINFFSPSTRCPSSWKISASAWWDSNDSNCLIDVYVYIYSCIHTCIHTYIYIMHRLTLECTISHNTVFKSQPGSTSSACHNHMALPPSLVAKPCPTSLGFFVFLQARHGSAGQRPFGQPRAAVHVRFKDHRTIYRPYTQQPRCKDRNVIYHNAGISTFLSF